MTSKPNNSARRFIVEKGIKRPREERNHHDSDNVAEAEPTPVRRSDDKRSNRSRSLSAEKDDDSDATADGDAEESGVAVSSKPTASGAKLGDAPTPNRQLERSLTQQANLFLSTVLPGVVAEEETPTTQVSDYSCSSTAAEDGSALPTNTSRAEDASSPLLLASKEKILLLTQARKAVAERLSKFKRDHMLSLEVICDENESSEQAKISKGLSTVQHTATAVQTADQAFLKRFILDGVTCADRIYRDQLGTVCGGALPPLRGGGGTSVVSQ